ncbi:hypothetical protein K1719_010757 [Acacia pycnantha]|nr:hypothetical protein K1719_010757 [Acacia pycnantha]
MDTDFAKVLNPSDGISVDRSNPLCPTFTFEEKERERLMRPFRRSLVVKLLGRRPSYGFMVKKLRQLWARKDSYLSVARWKPDFNPKSESIDYVVAWVRLPDLPALLFDKEFLLNLGNSIGRAIRLDIHTAQRARVKFARMCVELDLTKPLVPEFNVEGQVLSVAYESLGMLCNNCGRVGHTKEGCDAGKGTNPEGGMEVETSVEIPKGESGQKEGKELWKIVQKPRRPRGNNFPVQKQPLGSRFSVLNEVNGVGERQVGGVVVPDCIDKEGGLVKVHNKGVTKGFEKSGGMGGLTKGAERGRGKSVGKSEKEEKVVKEGDGRDILAEHNRGNSVRIENDSKRVYRSYEVVPETKLEKYGTTKVDMIDKENMHPGEHIGSIGGLEVKGLGRWSQLSEEDDPIESSGMVVEETCVDVAQSV